MIHSFFRNRRARKEAREVLHHARHVFRMRRDRLPSERRQAVENAIGKLAGLTPRIPGGAVDSDALADARRALEKRVGEITPRRAMPLWRENFEVILVALGVAMAFRAYFFQPFKIPTGSMQPTLYGIHSVDMEAPEVWDRYPMKIAKWVVTGKWYREVRVRQEGDLMRPRPEAGGGKPGYDLFQAAGHRYYVPSDAVNRGAMNRFARGNRRVRKGDVLWSGMVVSGDHLFVNRMIWNFRKPRRGEVVVFETSGIAMLDVDYPAGTHYIKRLVGLPGETLSIDPPRVLVSGKAAGDHGGIMDRIAARGRLADWAPAYGGYRPIGSRINKRDLALARRFGVPLLQTPNDAVTLDRSQYYALGDNTANSRDCRYFGPIPEANLVGPGAMVYWPFTSPRFGRVR